MADKKPIKLLSPFPKKLVKSAPKGKFGDYVPHAHYVERLRDSGVKYSWSVEPLYGTHKGVKRIVGAIGTITIEDMGSFMGCGDVDTIKLDNPKFNDGSNLKDAESDAFKRACMRFGLGVELWSGSEESEEESIQNQVYSSGSSVQSQKVRTKPAPVQPRPLDDIEEGEAPFSEPVKSTDGKLKIIEDTIARLLDGKTDEVKKYALDLADNYAKIKKYPDKSMWTNKQMDDYFAKLEIGLTKIIPASTGDDFIDSVQMELGEVVEKTLEQVNINQDKRTDLTCPCSNSRLVYDNRQDKKSEKSPDFVCSGRDRDECPMHTGQWRKSWWLNSNDLPKDWGFGK